MSRHNSADVSVIALIGERNREVRDFLEHELSADGLKRSVVVVATSDRPAPLRIRAGFVALAVAEYFRDQGADVLLVMDSVTRLAMAQREIGLAAGEPPSQKGYTPSVFNLLPKRLRARGTVPQRVHHRILHRAGGRRRFQRADLRRRRAAFSTGTSFFRANWAPPGTIRPSTCSTRSAGSRRGSRATDQKKAAQRLRAALADYHRSEDLINLGAYTAGTNPKLDAAIQLRPQSARLPAPGLPGGIEVRGDARKDAGDRQGRGITGEPRRAAAHRQPVR